MTVLAARMTLASIAKALRHFQGAGKLTRKQLG
jgi:hypothetical protein